ncbi:MAG: Ppx/GppA phosphatase family protein [Microthrixaceae bacterium]
MQSSSTELGDPSQNHSLSSGAGLPHPGLGKRDSAQPLPGAIAAIDIGTNSIHMLIARVASNGRFEVMTKQKEMVRLGSGRSEMKRLELDAIDRGVAALARCRLLAESFDAPIYAVATSAVREALNADEFLQRAQQQAGVQVQVISGLEEARLIQLGVLQALPVFDKRLALIDVGGGSTEIVFGFQGEVSFGRSVKLGSLRMTNRFFSEGLVQDQAVSSCREYVRGSLAPLAHEVAQLRHEVAIASSGTAESIANMIFARRTEPAPQQLNASKIRIEEITEIISLLASVQSADERRKLEGIDASRADILIGGAIVLEQACLAIGAAELVISEFALREGVLLDALHRLGGGTLHHLSDLRKTSVFHLMELCDDDPEHSLQVARLVLQLHDALAADLRLGDEERELLEAAALLSNVGLFVAHSGHHKHSYYVIRNSDHLMGFTDQEIEIIAQVARYHRKSPPSAEKHAEFASLTEEDQRRVTSMAALLRVAIGFDRHHDGSVQSVQVERVTGEVRMTLHADTDATELSLEKYSGTLRSSLLAEQLNCSVHVQTVARP